MSGSIDALAPLFPEMAALSIPLVVLHTDVGFGEIRKLADAHPELQIILESGPRKILYFLKDVEELLAGCNNVWLSTYNFCNWLGIEGMCEKGLGGRLLYGTHWPVYSPDVSMGPIVMGQLSWQQKCDIAGNNLRRLLDLAPEYPAEAAFSPPRQFVIDAHSHNLDAGRPSPYDFPIPDERLTPADWTDLMDYIAAEMMFLIPTEPLFDPAKTSREYSRRLREHAPGRFRYMEMFSPTGDGEHVRRVEASLADPACVGIKIHPSLHRVEADADAFEPVYQIAARFDKAIMTHSWEISSYNPVQYMSHPDRFRRHLEKYPKTRLVLGHAGGRSSALEATIGVCADFPNVAVDISGDYFDNGLVDCLVARLGAKRVLYGSDINWIDPRCNLAAVLGSDLSDEDALLMLRENALNTYT